MLWEKKLFQPLFFLSQIQAAFLFDTTFPNSLSSQAALPKFSLTQLFQILFGTTPKFFSFLVPLFQFLFFFGTATASFLFGTATASFLFGTATASFLFGTAFSFLAEKRKRCVSRPPH